MVLRVNRAWIEPPPQYKRKPTNSDSNAKADPSSDNAEESLLYNHDSVENDEQAISRMPVKQTPPTLASASLHRAAGFGRSHPTNDLTSANIIDMTPEMLVDEMQPETVSQTPNSRSHSINMHYNYLSVNPSPSPISPLKWPPMHPHGPGPSSRVYSTQFDQSYIQQAPLRYYPSAVDSNSPIGRSFRSTSSTKMMRLPRHARLADNTISETTLLTTTKTPPATAAVDSSATTNHTASGGIKSNRKVGRSVYSLPMPLDTGYTSVNTMSQLAFDQWLQARMEEFHYAGRAVDVQLVARGGGYINMRNPEFSLGVLAQIAYYVAQFDWCYFSRSGHVHCSVKPGKFFDF